MASESLPTQSINLPINGAEEGEYTFTSFLPTDVPAQHAVHSIDSVADKLSAVPKPYSLSDAEFWVSNNVALAELCFSLKTVEERREVLFGQSYGMPMQVIRHKGTMIGCCTCTPKPSPESKYRVELGYYLHPEHQGKGAMSVAARTVLRIAKEEYGVTCVMVAADFENAGSRKVILGLVKHVQMKQKKVVTGDFYVKRWPKGKYGESECERECGSWSWEL